MKKIYLNLKENRITYGFDTLVVIVGILIAFGLNNWNESRQDNKTRKNYLERLQIDLNQDKAGLINLRASHKYRALSADTILNLYADLKLEDAEIFKRSMYQMFFSEKFIAHDNTFKDMTSSGRLDLFTNNQIKFQLMELYTTYKNIQELELHYERDLNEYLYDPVAALIDMQKYSALPTDQLYEAQKDLLKADHRPINGVMYYSGGARRLQEIYSESLSQIATIDSLIVIELE